MSAIIFFEMIGTIFAVSVIYWAVIYPMFDFMNAYAVWFGKALGIQEIIDLGNFGGILLAALPYIFIMLTIVWAFRKAMERERYEQLYRLQ